MLGVGLDMLGVKGKSILDMSEMTEYKGFTPVALFKDSSAIFT